MSGATTAPHVCRPEFVVSAIITRRLRPSDPLEVLLSQRLREPAAGIWHTPGGSPEPGENAMQALRRELAEELDLTDVLLPSRLPVAYTYAMYRHRGADRHVHAHYYKGTIRDGSPRALDGTVAVDWFDIARARALYGQGLLLDTSASAIGQALAWNIRTA